MPVRIHSFRGHPAVTLSGGGRGLEATFLPELGMLGASLRFDGEEHLSLHGGLDGWRDGHTTGMALLHPWANRLGALRYRVGSTTVEVPKDRVQLEEHGLAIHGVMVGERRWSIRRLEDDESGGTLHAKFAFDEPPLVEVFPFPHQVEVRVTVDSDGMAVATTLRPSARRKVPVAFGWHPYFRLPGVTRRDLVVSLPARHHLALDERGLPTGDEEREPAEEAALGDRVFDDGYRLGRERRFALSGGGTRLIVEFDRNYPYAQVFAPRGRRFVAFEPMTAPTNALVSGSHPMVEPGDTFTASFRVSAAPG